MSTTIDTITTNTTSTTGETTTTSPAHAAAARRMRRFIAVPSTDKTDVARHTQASAVLAAVMATRADNNNAKVIELGARIERANHKFATLATAA